MRKAFKLGTLTLWKKLTYFILKNKISKKEKQILTWIFNAIVVEIIIYKFIYFVDCVLYFV